MCMYHIDISSERKTTNRMAINIKLTVFMITAHVIAEINNSKECHF